jgi:predicted GNAT family acetyltransferase
VRLQVLRKNRAHHLYERLGFVQTGQTDTHILMEKTNRTST